MNAISPIGNFALTAPQMRLVKDTIAKDCNAEEFDLYMAAARSYGLDPFRKQIIPLVFGKNAKDQSKRRMSIVVSRDGLRVIAQRCRNYRPASDPAEWILDPEAVSPLNPKGLIHCTIYLWQQDSRGDWFKVKGEADWDEFAPIAEEWAEGQDGKRRPTGNKTLDTSGNWAKMPKVMLEKCAEAQALRAGWPEQFGGLYAEEELDRAKLLDLTASEIVEAEAEEQRLKRIGATNAITVSWGDNFALEAVPVGQLGDRIAEFVKETTDLTFLRRWRDANRVGLQEFWAKAPSDAHAIKGMIETKLGEKVAA
jgi:phage recombination protein Bet